MFATLFCIDSSYHHGRKRAAPITVLHTMADPNSARACGKDRPRQVIKGMLDLLIASRFVVLTE